MVLEAGLRPTSKKQALALALAGAALTVVALVWLANVPNLSTCDTGSGSLWDCAVGSVRNLKGDSAPSAALAVADADVSAEAPVTPVPVLAQSEAPPANPEAAAVPMVPVVPPAAPEAAAPSDTPDPPPAAATGPASPAPADQPPSEVVSPVASPASGTLQMAAADQTEMAPGSDLAVPSPVLPPTIDMLQIGGSETLASGEGPAGAMILLYLDGRLVGQSEVVDGRWEVDGFELSDAPEQDMRIEAIDARTGKQLGVSHISIEIQLPDEGAPDAQSPPVAQPDHSELAPPLTPEPPLKRPDRFRQSPSVQVLGPVRGDSIITLGG